MGSDALRYVCLALRDISGLAWIEGGPFCEKLIPPSLFCYVIQIRTTG
jgi:hypothetical protein